MPQIVNLFETVHTQFLSFVFLWRNVHFTAGADLSLDSGVELGFGEMREKRMALILPFAILM